MFSKYWRFAMLFSFLLLALVICIGFNTMNGISSGNNQPMFAGASKLINYGRIAFRVMTYVASPVLNRLGFEIEGKFVEVSNEIHQQVEEAAWSLEETKRKLTQ